MMCSRLLRDHESHGRVYNWLERGLTALNQGYRNALKATLTVRPLVILVAVAVAGASIVLFFGLKSELAPVEDRGVLYTAGSAPEGSTIDFTARYAGEFEELLSKIPEVEHFFIIAGRSEEHTSELQSLMRISYAVFCLKKKTKTKSTKLYT